MEMRSRGMSPSGEMRMNIFDNAPLPYRSPPQFITPRHFGEPQWHAIFFASTWNL